MVLQENDVARAFNFALERHRDQVDKGGTTYIGHLVWVAARLHVLFPEHATPELRIIALLHDVIEDGKATWLDVQKEFGILVACKVEDMCRRGNETYANYIKRISLDPDLTRVKICDLQHNSDLSRLPVIWEEDEARARKYEKWENFLMLKLKGYDEK